MMIGSEPERFGVRPGVPVVTKDGEKLGTVKECDGPSFKVAAGMQPDYWLQSSLASPDAGGSVTMDFIHEHLDQYKVRERDGELRNDPASVSDANLVGESGPSTDQTRTTPGLAE